jgi:type IV pilus assembly protein PilW
MKHDAYKTSRQRALGFSLVELMIALAIGSFLMAGAIYIYSQTRNSYIVNDAVGRMQEEARFAFSIIEPDIQLAGLYGFTNNYNGVSLVAAGITTSANDMQQKNGAAPGLAATLGNCGRNFAVDLLQTVQGSDQDTGFVLGPGAAAPAAGSGCATGAPVATADSLTVRHSTPAETVLQPGRLQIYALRLEPNAQTMFVNGVAPGALIPTLREIRDLVVNTNYVSQNSDARAGFPALRQISLGAAQTFVDNEIVPGVEDLQVQFGVETGDYNNDGVIDRDRGGDGIADTSNGIATRYVNADDVILQPPPVGRSAQVVTVRIWLRLRAEQIEQGFQDTRRYQYANVDWTPPAAQSGFRRLLVSRTIYLRNARTL